MKPRHCTDNLWWDHALFSLWCVHCPCSSGYKCSFSNCVTVRITPGLIRTDSEAATWSFSQSSYIHHDHGPRQRVTHSSYHLRIIIIVPCERSPGYCAILRVSSCPRRGGQTPFICHVPAFPNLPRHFFYILIISNLIIAYPNISFTFSIIAYPNVTLAMFPNFPEHCNLFVGVCASKSNSESLEYWER